MKDLLFYVADGNMEQAIRGFMERDALQQRVGCGPIDFDARRDIKVAKGQADPGIYTRGDELLRPFHGEYRHVALIVDEEWDGSPGAETIRERLAQHLAAAGWEETGLPLVVCPEADVWLWTDTDHTARALGWANWLELSRALVVADWLVEGSVKPARPKEAAEWALFEGPQDIKRSSALYRRITSKVSANRCTADSVHTLLATLRAWFPA